MTQQIRWVRRGLVWRSTAPRPIDEDYETLRATRRRRHEERVDDQQQQRRDALMAWWQEREAEEDAWRDRTQREANLATFQRWAA